MIRILFPYNISEIDNEYVSRIIEILETEKNYQVTASLDEFWNTENPNTYQYIIINWPDYLFNWRKDLTQNDIDKYLETVDFWQKKSAKIFIIRHDLYPHTHRTEFRIKLYDTANESANGIIHLGEYSQKEYFERYKNAQEQVHQIIPHPLYKVFDTSISKEFAKRKLNIPQNSFYLFAAGSIGKKEDYDRCLKILKTVSHSKKKLGMNISGFLVKKPDRKKLFKFLVFKIKQIFNEKIRGVKTYHKFLPNDFLGLNVAAADLIIISRTNTLNSGNVFLGSQFGKIIIGPDCGNIKEQLSYLDQIIYSHAAIDDTLKTLNEQIEDRNNPEFESEVKNKIFTFSELFYIRPDIDR